MCSRFRDAFKKKKKWDILTSGPLSHFFNFFFCRRPLVSTGFIFIWSQWIYSEIWEVDQFTIVGTIWSCLLSTSAFVHFSNTLQKFTHGKNVHTAKIFTLPGGIFFVLRGGDNNSPTVSYSHIIKFLHFANFYTLQIFTLQWW